MKKTKYPSIIMMKTRFFCCIWSTLLLYGMSENVTTTAPSQFPSLSPTALPSLNPSSTPSSTPSKVPSSRPSFQPSFRPSSLPSFQPSVLPTRIPSGLPTLTPSTKPSLRPSVQHSRSPSQAGTHVPSSSPSVNPTPSSFAQYGAIVQPDISMTLTGTRLEILTPAQMEKWQNETSRYIVNYFLPQIEIGRIDVKLKITAQKKVISTQHEKDNDRRLKESDISLTYTQITSYTGDAEFPSVYFVEEPFFNVVRRQDYIANYLNDFLPEVSTITIPSIPVSTPVPTPSSSSSLSTSIIVGIAVGAGVALLCLILGILWYSRQRKRSLWSKPSSTVREPPSQLQLHNAPDEVSTLAEPIQRLGTRSNDSIDYGEGSVTTVDYDYSGAYAGGGESVVSSVGGTMGDSTTRGGKSTLVSAAGHSQPSFLSSDDDGYNSSFRSNAKKTKKEQYMDVYAPPGKLGVVIDTPDDGPPTVHAIKDSSCIADKLQVGDKLLAVDDENVRGMTAIKVSKLISRKSSNATRKLTILRTTFVEQS